jgi:hypothetical protein
MLVLRILSAQQEIHAAGQVPPDPGESIAVAY